MGELHYNGVKISFEDCLLRHLEVVIINKLRRREGFAMNWRNPPAAGDGRCTIWLDPSIPLIFTYAGATTPPINRNWIEALGTSASSSSGLVVTDESGNEVRGTLVH